MGFNTAITRIVKSLYGSGHYLDWVQLWFLPQLFVVSLYAFIFIALVSKLQNRWIRWGILLAILAISLPFLNSFYPFQISVFGKEYELFGLPFSLDLVFLTGFFFILGNEIRQITSEKTFDNLFILVGTGIGLVVLNYLFPYEIDFNIRQYESFLVNTTEAILGILFILALSRQIELHTNRLATVFKYLGNISLIILLFHVPIQAFWGEKVMNVTDNFPLSILIGFIMGVLGPILIYEIFIRFNAVASFWFGRKAESLVKKEPEVKEELTVPNPPSTPVVEVKEQ
jgi:fucose 4-O-acetylase-like acetyltransferase